MLKLSAFWRNRNEEIAAIDLGSNSFHMIIARVENGQFSIVDRMKEPVRLGMGLDEHGNLNEQAQKRALACLERFSQRISHLPPSSVRAIGTRTLRQARNTHSLLVTAERALGHAIHIVSGSEEARLVYQGVAFGLEDDHEKRLVVDIGGGSTELIIGEDFTPEALESIGLGCVSVTMRFFRKGKISAKTIKQAEIYCRQKLEPIRAQFQEMSWQRAIGCSGSIKAVSEVIGELTGHPLITQQGIDMLLTQCRQLESIDHLNFPSLSSQRQPVFIGGLIILKTVMDALNIESMEASPWALREGVLFDLLGHDSISDMRQQSVASLAKRFHIRERHAQLAEKNALTLFRQIEQHFDAQSSWAQYLSWACQLQKVGLDINHERYHVHSGYIVENSHLAGFGFDEQNRLAFLVRNHRKKPDWRQIERLPTAEQPEFNVVLLVFRLACTLARSQSFVLTDDCRLTLKDQQLTFSAPSDWWDNQPLASADLEAEQAFLKKGPIKLKLKVSADA